MATPITKYLTLEEIEALLFMLDENGSGFPDEHFDSVYSKLENYADSIKTFGPEKAKVGTIIDFSKD